MLPLEAFSRLFFVIWRSNHDVDRHPTSHFDDSRVEISPEIESKYHRREGDHSFFTGFVVTGFISHFVYYLPENFPKDIENFCE
jgi:hypothetical protein